MAATEPKSPMQLVADYYQRLEQPVPESAGLTPEQLDAQRALYDVCSTNSQPYIFRVKQEELALHGTRYEEFFSEYGLPTTRGGSSKYTILDKKWLKKLSNEPRTFDLVNFALPDEIGRLPLSICIWNGDVEMAIYIAKMLGKYGDLEYWQLACDINCAIYGSVVPIRSSKPRTVSDLYALFQRRRTDAPTAFYSPFSPSVVLGLLSNGTQLLIGLTVEKLSDQFDEYKIFSYFADSAGNVSVESSGRLFHDDALPVHVAEIYGNEHTPLETEMCNFLLKRTNALTSDNAAEACTSTSDSAEVSGLGGLDVSDIAESCQL